MSVQRLIEIFYTFTYQNEREKQLDDAKEKLINLLGELQQK